MFYLTKIEHVIHKVLPHISHTPQLINLKLIESLNKIAGIDIFSKIDLPPQPKATMDGYAVRHYDVSGASRENPIPLRIIGSISIPFKSTDIKVRNRECCFIETGCFLPQGADAVVKIEDVMVEGNIVYIMKTPSKYENVSLIGEELKKGDMILRKGMRIKPWHLAALRLHKISEVPVLDLKCLIINTGEEFIKKLHEPFTVELIKAWLLNYGFLKVDDMIVSDDIGEIKESIRKGINYYDLVILCGGTSLGRRDITVKAIKELSPSILIHGIAIQPGKTTCVSVIKGKLVVAMSGLPAAAYANLELLLHELLNKWLKVEPLLRCKVRGILTKRVTTKSGIRAFVRVKLHRENGNLYVEPLLTGGSGSLRSLLLSNGYLVIPEDIEGYDEGEVVEVVIHTPLF